MMKNINFREARPSDAASILSLIKDLSEYEKLSNEVVADRHDIEKILADKNCFFCYIAERNDDVVAFCIGFYTLSTFLGKKGLYIEDIFVKETDRHLGIGKNFFRILAKKAVEEDFGRIEWSVLDWNEPSIQFYERLGSRALKEWIKYRLEGEKIKKILKD